MAVSFTKSQLVLRFPEFADESAERVAAMLDMARVFVDETVFDGKATTALMLYTAHLLSMTSPHTAGASGPVTMEKVGDLSRSYAAQGGQAEGLRTTKYGQMFLKLAKNESAGPMEVQPAFNDPDGLDGQPA